MTSDLKSCEDILNKLKRHSKATPFLEPVDYVALKIPDYPEKIKTPMDLKTVSQKMKDYTSQTEFVNDVKLIFSNCYLYNGEDSPISKMAHELDTYFDSLLGKSLKNNVDLEVCTNVLNELLKTKYKKINWPFLEPVDIKLVPNYLSVIENPIDLSTIKRKLPFYENRIEFFADLLLMVNNCYKFNAKGTDIYSCGEEMEKLIDRNCGFLNEKDLINNISQLKQQMAALSSTMSLYEDVLFHVRKKEGKRKIFSLDERIRIADIVSKLDEERCVKIALIIKKNDQNFSIAGKEEVEVDFKILPDFIVEEIDTFLKKENVNIEQSSEC